MTLALESAIESVETIYSRDDELRALRSLHQLVESSEIGWSEVMIKPRDPMLIIDQPATQTEEANHRPKNASLIVERLLHWPNTAPLLRGVMVAIFALGLGAVLIHFGHIGRQAAPPSPSQREAAPMAPAAIARPDAFSHRRFVDAGAPALVLGNALSNSDRHDAPTVASDEQPMKAPGPNHCTQTYTVPSEGGGQASISIVRCR